MGGKKKKAGGKKKKGGGELTLTKRRAWRRSRPQRSCSITGDSGCLFEAKIRWVDLTVVKEQEKADESKAAENELRGRVVSLDKIMEEEKQDTWKIT